MTAPNSGCWRWRPNSRPRCSTAIPGAALATGVVESRIAVRELRELTNGLHPSVLSDGGLTSAFDDLATRLPVRVQVSEPGRRFPHHVEAATWFVVCEAVTNAVKHADTARITLTPGHQQPTPTPRS